MKVQDIITRVRNIAGDIDVLQFTNDQLVDWINDGVRECAVQNNLLQKRATQNLVVGTTDYNLPADILKLHSVKIDGEKIRIQTLEEFDQFTRDSTNTGMPIAAYVWAGKLTLWPKPNTVKPLIIDYTYDPVLLTVANIATDTPDLPVGYHARLVDYCLAQVAQQDDDMPRYQLKMQEFATGVQTLKDIPEWQDDLYPSISVSPRDMGTGWGEDY